MLLFRALFVSCAVIGLSACISPKAYVDPAFREAKAGEIKAPKTQYPVSLQVQFQRNGEALPVADAELRSAVEQALAASGVLVVDAKGSPLVLSVVANNLADIGDATAKGFGTGLTFGAVGTTVTDYYEFQVSLTDADGKAVGRQYKHAIHTVIGIDDAPVSCVEPVALAEAFVMVVRDVVDNFLKAMQADGQLTQRIATAATAQG